MKPRSKIWPLQEAKARFSELVRLAQTEGPQTVTVRGRPPVKMVTVSAPMKRPCRNGWNVPMRRSAPAPPVDFLIAAIASVKHCAVVTREAAPFADAGVPVFDPWTNKRLNFV